MAGSLTRSASFGCCSLSRAPAQGFCGITNHLWRCKAVVSSDTQHDRFRSMTPSPGKWSRMSTVSAQTARQRRFRKGGENLTQVWLIDGMNLIGSRPDGWWKDPDRAMRTLAGRLDEYVERTGEHVVLKGKAVNLPRMEFE